MEYVLKNSNIVILAKNYNPSIVSKEWLKEKKVIEENAVKFTHTPVFSLVQTDNFTFILDPDRLQISVNNSAIENIDNLPKVAERFIAHLPETPYTAVGFNFLFHLNNVKNSFKSIFKNDETKFTKLFSAEYKLGGAVYFKHDEFVSRVQITPVDTNQLIADYNFHFDGAGIDKLKLALAKYSTAKDKALAIMKELFYV